MGRSLDDVLALLPGARRARIEMRTQELKDEVESLGELRLMAGKAQTEIASSVKRDQSN